MDEQMHYGEDYKYIPVTSILSMVGQEVIPDIYCLTIQIVNVCFIGHPTKDNGWTLVDAGMPRSAKAIIKEAEQRFGPHARPDSILLTHGHFDHVGAIIELVEHWDVPVYAHPLEIPFLTGEQDYPKPDSTVGGGLVARMSPLFPNDAISLGSYIKPLPEDSSVPNLPDWQWLHTPGHSPGHVSFFRNADRVLITGDAFVTVKQESLYKVLIQDKQLSGPPKYFTTDWEQAWASVKLLKALRPEIAVTGHGIPMNGMELRENLAKLAQQFDQLAMPQHGKNLH